MTRFLIVRHGETLWNREHRIQGQRNSELSSAGVRQAQATAQRLRGEGGVRLIASDLGRTVQTAQPVAAALGLELELELDARLRERCFGEFEGSTPDEVRERMPDAYLRWQSREPSYAMPGGESLLALRDRARACLESIAAVTSGTVIIVTHGGTLDAMYRLAASLALDAPRTWPLLNSSINTIQIEAGVWHLRTWGDVAHLPAAEDDFG